MLFLLPCSLHFAVSAPIHPPPTTSTHTLHHTSRKAQHLVLVDSHHHTSQSTTHSLAITQSANRNAYRNAYLYHTCKPQHLLTPPHIAQTTTPANHKHLPYPHTHSANRNTYLHHTSRKAQSLSSPHPPETTTPTFTTHPAKHNTSRAAHRPCASDTCCRRSQRHSHKRT